MGDVQQSRGSHSLSLFLQVLAAFPPAQYKDRSNSNPICWRGLNILILNIMFSCKVCWGIKSVGKHCMSVVNLNIPLWFYNEHLHILFFFFNPPYFLFKLAYLFNGALYSTAQNKSISMSMDPKNSTEDWLDKGISLYPNYTVGADLLIYLCVPVWLRYKVSFLPCGCLCLDIILDYSFFDQTTHWIRKKRFDTLMWCNLT